MTSKEFLSRWAIFGEHEPVETIEDILQDKKINGVCIPGCRMLSEEECRIWQVKPVDSDEEIDEQWLEMINRKIRLYVYLENMNLSPERLPAEHF